MNMTPRASLLLALVLGALACGLYFKFRSAGDEVAENAYFYDLDEHQLFVAPRKSIPPIPGIKGKSGAAVRAVVISTTGNPKDKQHRKIAYLQKYSPEMKQVLEDMQQARTEARQPVTSVDRGAATANNLVRRLNDTEWQPLSSMEGERITTDWNQPGPDGKTPVVCSP